MPIPIDFKISLSDPIENIKTKIDKKKKSKIVKRSLKFFKEI